MPELDGRTQNARGAIVNRITKIIEELAQLAEPLEVIDRAGAVGFAAMESNAGGVATDPLPDSRGASVGEAAQLSHGRSPAPCQTKGDR